MSYSSNFLAEKFIQTVGRAFFTDTVVVVIDALVREKYIREEELGPRLRMSQKQARESIAKLMDIEMLVKCEEIPLPEIDLTANPSSKQTVKFYYIDYQAFVNIVRYRVYIMLKAVQSQEKSHVDDIYFECPTCKSKYSMLEAMKQRSSDFKFICTNCCPDIDISRCVSQSYFRLKEVDNRGKLSEVQKLEKKLKEQLSRSADHDGILEMLDELKNIPLNRNRPSTNIKRGIRASAVKSSDVANEIREIVDAKTNVKNVVDIKEKHFNILSTRLDGTQKQSIIAEKPVDPIKKEDIAISSDVVDGEHISKKMRKSDMPDFLKESGVIGSSAIMKEVEALHMSRGMGTNIAAPSFSEQNDPTSTSSILFSRNSDTNISSKIAQNNDSDKEEEEDIAWEEEDE